MILESIAYSTFRRHILLAQAHRISLYNNTNRSPHEFSIHTLEVEWNMLLFQRLSGSSLHYHEILDRLAIKVPVRTAWYLLIRLMYLRPERSI